MKRPELERTLAAKLQSGKLFVPYLTAGLPSPQRFVETVSDLTGVAAAVEVGIPFSDPIMDGPVIQEASMRALQLGMTMEASLDLIKETRRYVDLPIIVMTYFNPIHRMGLEKFAERMARAGGSGLIVPDLPLEESEELHRHTKKRGLALIQMVSPMTSESRTAAIAEVSEGFVYAVSRLGVTGEQQSLAESAAEVVSRIRPHTKVPILLGIGVSDAEQAREAARYADGVIVGTAIMKKVLAGDTAGVATLARELAASLS